MPRNRLLADALYRARLIERWGTGTLRIVRERETAGMPHPEFLIEMGMFIVRFRGRPEGSLEDRIPTRKRQVIAYVMEHGAINRSQYQALSGLRARQAAEDLAALVREGLLVRKGKGPAIEYVLAEINPGS